MSEILMDYDWQGRKGAPTKYPWEKWADGQIRKIVKGEDYVCKSSSIQAILRSQLAKLDGMDVRTSLVDEGNAVVFQYYAKEE